MKKLLLVAMVLTSVLVVSCGSDSNGSGNGGTASQKVVPTPSMK